MKERGRRGQISIEYLIVVGFIVFFAIIILGLAMFYSNQINSTMKIKQVEQFARKVISSAESVYYAGEPSKSTISIYLPEGISQIQILQREIFVAFRTDTGENRVSYLSNVPLEGNLSISSGVKRITIIALSDRVSING